MNDRNAERLRQVLAESQRERFDAGFADRALARARATDAVGQNTELAIDLVRYCRRAIPAAIAAALLLAVHNVVRTRGAGSSTVAAVLGFTPPSSTAAMRASPASSQAASNVISVESIYGLGPAMPGGD